MGVIWGVVRFSFFFVSSRSHACLRKARGQLCASACASASCQGEIQLAVGGLAGSKQVYLSFPESTPYQPDRLGMESLFSGEHELS